MKHLNDFNNFNESSLTDGKFEGSEEFVVDRQFIKDFAKMFWDEGRYIPYEDHKDDRRKWKQLWQQFESNEAVVKFPQIVESLFDQIPDEEKYQITYDTLVQIAWEFWIQSRVKMGSEMMHKEMTSIGNFEEHYELLINGKMSWIKLNPYLS